MKNVLFLALILISTASFAQQTPQSLVKEGTALNDKGLYDEAIAKYDAALAQDKNYYLAYYEKAYTLMMQKKYDESIELSKFILSNFKDGSENGSVYINYGTCLDYQGKPEKAIAAYNDGIKAYPKLAL